MTVSWNEYCISLIPKMKLRFEEMLGYQPNLTNPIRFTEKLEWLKAYDSSFLKTYCSDKLTAKKYVQSIIGKDITIPTIGVYENFNDIKFNKLPSNYVIKTNHGSHTNIIVKNGNINIPQARNKFTEWLSKDWSYWGFEMFYSIIPKYILIEPYMNDGHADLIDYKFLCFNGTPLYCQVISDRHNSAKHLNYYDMTFTPCTNISRIDFKANYNIIHEKPKTFDTMINYAKILSANFKFVRVDFYEINGELYFGELTFIPAAGYIKWTDNSIDYKFGRLLNVER